MNSTFWCTEVLAHIPAAKTVQWAVQGWGGEARRSHSPPLLHPQHLSTGLSSSQNFVSPRNLASKVSDWEHICLCKIKKKNMFWPYLSANHAKEINPGSHNATPSVFLAHLPKLCLCLYNPDSLNFWMASQKVTETTWRPSPSHHLRSPLKSTYLIENLPPCHTASLLGGKMSETGTHMCLLLSTWGTQPFQRAPGHTSSDQEIPVLGTYTLWHMLKNPCGVSFIIAKSWS